MLEIISSIADPVSILPSEPLDKPDVELDRRVIGG
jgi:hypothetical protein